MTRPLFVCLLMLLPSLVLAEDWVYPLDVAAGQNGEFYIADRKLPGILKLADGQISVHVQGDKKFRTPMNAVRCVHVTADGTLLAGDSATREVYRVAADGTLTPLTSGTIGIPTEIATHGDFIYVTDLELSRVWKFPLAGGTPQEVAVVAGPRGVAVDADGSVWVLSPQKPQLRRIAADGNQTVVHEGLTFEFPQDVLVSADGSAFVSDGYAKCIWKIAPGAEPVKWGMSEKFSNPVGMGWEGENILLIDSRAPGLFRIAPSGEVAQVFPAE